jgi:hypothetical protein
VLEEAGTATGVELEATTTAATAFTLTAAGASMLESSARVQPLLAMMAAGQETCLNETVGLSLPWNQSKRQ